LRVLSRFSKPLLSGILLINSGFLFVKFMVLWVSSSI
jgi:hypothetical protein